MPDPEPAPPLEGEHEADVVVLGAGLTGCAAAAEVARRGLRAIVLDAGGVGGGATAGELGHLRGGPGLLYSDAIERWGRERARQVWECHRETQARLRELAVELGDDFGHRSAGGFVLTKDREDGVRLAESEDLLREDGFAGEFLDGYMLETRFDISGFSAGYWAADESEVDAQRLVQGLARRAREAGARLYERTAVRHLQPAAAGVEAVTPRGRVRAAWAFLALGTATSRLAPALAPALRPVPETGVLFALAGGARLPSPARLAGQRAAWRVTPSGLAVVMSADTPAPAGTPEALIAAHAPGAGGVLERWTRTRAHGRDDLPLVGRLPGLPAAASCAYGGLGEVLAVLAARWAVTAMFSGDDPTPEPFRLARAVARPDVPQ